MLSITISEVGGGLLSRLKSGAVGIFSGLHCRLYIRDFVCCLKLKVRSVRFAVVTVASVCVEKRATEFQDIKGKNGTQIKEDFLHEMKLIW